MLPKYVVMLGFLKKKEKKRMLTFIHLMVYVCFKNSWTNMCSVVNYSTFYFDNSILVIIIIYIRE